MMLADYLVTLPKYTLADLYDTLYQPATPHRLSEEEYRAGITDYWNTPAHWDTMIDALSTTERQTMIRLALHERCKIDAFMEELAGLGLLILYRERNRYEMPDDVRLEMLERLPSLRDFARAPGEDDGEGNASI
jgi:hypothetical protein